VRLGEYDLASEADCSLDNITVECPGSTTDYALAELLIHSGFNPQDKTEFRNDIGLIRLQTRVQISGTLSIFHVHWVGGDYASRKCGKTLMIMSTVAHVSPLFSLFLCYRLRQTRVSTGSRQAVHEEWSSTRSQSHRRWLGNDHKQYVFMFMTISRRRFLLRG
jgi:hypothetical protein